MSERNSANNPYPGLRAFGFADRELFFGREKQSEELLRRLRRNRFLAVVGTSGSGKSSLVRAGLLPLISRGLDADVDAPWTVAHFRPGKDPIYNMAAALTRPARLDNVGAQVEGPSLETDDGQLKATVIETTLRRSAIGLADYLKRWQSDRRERFLIFIDQFEELFRFKEQSQGSHPEDEAAAFVKLLLEATYDNSVSAYVLVTMRSDFLGDCAQFRDLPEAINRGQYLIPRMTRDEQRAAITQPAALLNGEMTPRLVQRLLNDMGDNPDHLPLLQHTLMRIWDQWAAGPGEGPIDLSDYESIGTTMQEALSKHAEETYDALPDLRHQKIAEQLFRALTETVVNNREIRRPAELQEICDIAVADIETVTAVINHFRAPGRSFLMPPPDQRLAKDTVIDVSHESLIRSWTQLKQWVEEEARSKAMYQRLADAGKRRYDESEGASLWRDPDLKFAIDWFEREHPNEDWAKRYDSHFKEAMAFLDESKAEHEREIQIEEEELRAEEERKERERQRELTAAQEALVAQQKIAEAERERAKEAQLREAAEHENANTERRRAEEQAKFARRLTVAVVALIIMLLAALVATALAVFQKKRADVAYAQLDKAYERATDLSKSLSESLNTSQDLYLRAENENAKANEAQKTAEAANRVAQTEKLRAQQEKRKAELARNVAEREKLRANEATARAEAQALELATSLNNLKAARETLDLEREGFENLEKGETDLAIEKFGDLLGRYKNDGRGAEAIAWTWASYNFGRAQRQAKNYEKASDAYEQAIKKQKSIFGETDLAIAPAVERLAQVRYEQGDYPRAESEYHLLQKIIEDAGPRVTLDRIVNLKRDQAKLFHDQGRDARIAEKDAISELNDEEEKVYRINLAETAKTDEHLADSIRKRDRLRSKIAEYQRVETEKYSQAESSYQEVVSKLEPLLPEIRPDLIEAYSALAAFYQDQAQLYKSASKVQQKTAAQTKASKLYELARVMRENKITPGKNELEKLSTLVEAYDRQNKQGPVTALLTRKLELERDAKKPFDKTLMELLTSFYKQEKDDQEKDKEEKDKEARDQHEKDRQAKNKKVQAYLEELFINLRIAAESGKDSEEMQRYRESAYPLLDVLIAKQKNDEAEKLFQYLLKIQDNTLDLARTDDNQKFMAYRKIMLLNIMASLWFNGENYSRAEELSLQVMDLAGKTYGVDGDWQSWLSYGLAATYARQGRDDEAVRFFERTQKLFEKTIGPQQRLMPGKHELQLQIRSGHYLLPEGNEYLGTLSKLAFLYGNRGDNALAEETYKELVAVSKWLITNNISLKGFPFNEEERQELNTTYEGWYADALEQYSDFLSRLGRTQESSKQRLLANDIRERIGPSKNDEFGLLRRRQ